MYARAIQFFSMIIAAFYCFVLPLVSEPNSVHAKTYAQVRYGSSGEVDFKGDILHPMLSKDNYNVCFIKMRTFLKAQGLWKAVEGSDEPTKVQMALTVIYQPVPDGIILLLAEKETTKEAWEALKNMYLGAESIQEVRVQTLKAEFENLKMEKTESIDEFPVRLTTVVNQIWGLEETYVVKKFLRAASKKFLPISSAIEQFGDFKHMTVEEVSGKLKAYEERTRESDEEGSDHMLLSREEWNRQEARKVGEGEILADGSIF